MKFGIGMMMLVTTIVAIAAAAMGGLRRAEDRPSFVLFTLLAPVLVLIMISCWQHLTRRK